MQKPTIKSIRPYIRQIRIIQKFPFSANALYQPDCDAYCVPSNNCIPLLFLGFKQQMPSCVQQDTMLIVTFLVKGFSVCCFFPQCKFLYIKKQTQCSFLKEMLMQYFNRLLYIGKNLWNQFNCLLQSSERKHKHTKREHKRKQKLATHRHKKKEFERDNSK